MSGLILVFDLDSIVIDLLGPWVTYYNNIWNDNKTVSDITDYHIEKIVKPECGAKIYDVFKDPGFYPNLPPIDGAIEALYKLHNQGHDVVIATAIAGFTPEERAKAAGDKYLWCGKNIPFIPQRNIQIGTRKELIHADVFVDDSPSNIQAYKKKWPNADVLSIAYPYNIHMRLIVRYMAQDYQNTKQAWNGILEEIQDIQEGL
jgi:5'-nucleotidase